MGTRHCARGASILVVEAHSQSRQSLVTAVNAARYTPGVVAISMSWGFAESAGEASYNSVFTTPPGHRGITFLAASGDSGPPAGAEWPSVAPSVVAVGGTTLNLSFSGHYQYETAWFDSSGGLSRYEREPSFQRSVQGTGKRSTPDVAFDGDPNTGVRVYQTSLYCGRGLVGSCGWHEPGHPGLGGDHRHRRPGPRACKARDPSTEQRRHCRLSILCHRPISTSSRRQSRISQAAGGANTSTGQGDADRAVAGARHGRQQHFDHADHEQSPHRRQNAVYSCYQHESHWPFFLTQPRLSHGSLSGDRISREVCD